MASLLVSSVKRSSMRQAFTDQLRLQLIINTATALVSTANAPSPLKNLADQCQLQLPSKATVDLHQANTSEAATHKAATAHHRALLRVSMVDMARLPTDLLQANMEHRQDLLQGNTAHHLKALLVVTMAVHHKDTMASTSSLLPWHQALQRTRVLATFPAKCQTLTWVCKPMGFARP